MQDISPSTWPKIISITQNGTRKTTLREGSKKGIRNVVLREGNESAHFSGGRRSYQNKT